MYPNLSQTNSSYSIYLSLQHILSQPFPTYPLTYLNPTQHIPSIHYTLFYPNLFQCIQTYLTPTQHIPTYSYNLSYPNLFQCIQTYLNPTQHISTYPNVSQPSWTYPNPTFYLISSSIFPAGLSTGTTCTDIILS